MTHHPFLPQLSYSYTSTMKLAAFLFSIVASSLTNDANAIFAPRSRVPIVSLKNTNSYSYSHLKESATLSQSLDSITTAMAVSGGASKDDDSSSGLLQSLIDTDILVIDTDVAATEISDNWGLILLSGTLGVVAGCLALYNPFEATDVAFLSSLAALTVSGVINTGGSLFAERGYKILTLILGISQLALSAGIMTIDPSDSELGLSLAVCMSVFADGLYRVVLAVQNPDLPGWWPTFLGGFVGMATSAYVTKYMPLTFIAAPGIAMGVSLVTTGIARIWVGLAGRKLAKDTKS